MISVDVLLYRRYDARHYNCAHFVVEAWEYLFGQSISDKMHGFLCSIKERKVSFGLRRDFFPLSKPKSPCLVWMSRIGYPPHVGIFLRGRILHIQNSGPVFQSVYLATLGFKKIRYYSC